MTPAWRVAEDRTIDTLPKAAEDRMLPYYGYWNWTYCRLRVYRPADGPVLIVLTNTGNGTSITNVAETAHAAAWVGLGRPVPIRFFEHYQGRPRRLGLLDEEHLDEVRFDGTAGDGPIEGARRLPDGCLIAVFRQPVWRRTGLADFRRLVEGDPDGP